MRCRDEVGRLVGNGMALLRVVIGQAEYESCGESRARGVEGSAEWKWGDGEMYARWECHAL